MPTMEYTESRWVGALKTTPMEKLENLVIKIEKAINGIDFEGETPYERNLPNMTLKRLNFQLETIQRIIDERNES